MKVAVFKPNTLPCSIKIYYTHVRKELEEGYNCQFFEFNLPGEIPEGAEICWDPRGGRGAPAPWLISIDIPFVATFHGAVHLALPFNESLGLNPSKWFAGVRERCLTVNGWAQFNNGLTNIIAVSDYARSEFIKSMGFSEKNVHRIYHGIDQEQFTKKNDDSVKGEYFLHISSYQPKKNIKRIIKAYQSIIMDNKPKLIIISPGYNNSQHINGVEIITELKSHQELVSYYQNAIAFLFPSLHETFGFPILEAMASGCPVITSNNTACIEIASDAAILVDARSVKEISKAMKMIINDEKLRIQCIKNGLQRVQEFTWSETAKRHFYFFNRIINRHD